jgi:hypothetical protein
MRRNPKLICLYDGPLYPRSRPHSTGRCRVPLASYFMVVGSLLLAGLCVADWALPRKAISVAARPAPVPTAVVSLPRFEVPTIAILSSPEVPAPDMNAPAVLFANSDVRLPISATIAAEQSAAGTDGSTPLKATNSNKGSEKVRVARNEKLRATRRRTQEAAHAYAFSGFMRPLFGAY